MKSDATAHRAELVAAVAVAEDEQRAVRRHAEQARETVARLRQELAARPADEFGANGSVKQRTEAARIFRELETARSPAVPWEGREREAGEKVALARRAVDRFTEAHIVALVKGRVPEAERIDDEIPDVAAGHRP